MVVVMRHGIHSSTVVLGQHTHQRVFSLPCCVAVRLRAHSGQRLRATRAVLPGDRLGRRPGTASGGVQRRAMCLDAAVIRTADDVAAWVARLPVGEAPPSTDGSGTDPVVSYVSCTGRVTAARRNKVATFCDIELSNDDDNASGDPACRPALLQLVLQRDRLAENEARFKALSALLAPGAKLTASGHAACDRPGGLSLYATQLQLLACDSTAASVTRLVDLASTGIFSHQEVCLALSCEPAALTELITLREQANMQPDEATVSQQAAGVSEPKAKKQRRYEYKQAVIGTARLLQGLPPKREARQRTQRLSKADASKLDELEARVRALPAVSAVHHSSGIPPIDSIATTVSARVAAAVSAQLQESQSLRDPHARCCRGPGSRADYLHGKKRPQVEWMLTKICAIVEDCTSTMHSQAREQLSTPMAEGSEACQSVSVREETPRRRLQIVDVGGGRGDLALCVAQALPYCDVTVIDTNAKSVADGAARAAVTGLQNIRFICDDAAQAGLRAPPDLLIGLHACGGLTDLILQLATTPRLKHTSADGDDSGVAFPSFVVVPCCFNKHPELVSHDCDWAEAASTSDGATRLLPDEVAFLQRLAESSDRSASRRAMWTINSLRLEAVRRKRNGSSRDEECEDKANHSSAANFPAGGMKLSEFPVRTPISFTGIKSRMPV